MEFIEVQTAETDLKNYPNVYQPSEDSYLFLDAIQADLPFLQLLQPTCIAEIGSGSGVLISSLANVLKNCSYFSTDINLEACEATCTTAELNNVNIGITCMDLLNNFRRNVFDVVIFNPPYVVTNPIEMKGNGLNRAWAGGVDGREITDKLLCNIWEILSEKGVLYLCVIKENKPYEIRSLLESKGFKSSIVRERKIVGEHLFILKFYK